MNRRLTQRSILYATFLLLIIFSAIAGMAPIHQAQPCFAMPLSHIFLINETMAVLAALVFLLVAYCISAILNKRHK